MIRKALPLKGSVAQYQACSFRAVKWRIPQLNRTRCAGDCLPWACFEHPYGDVHFAVSVPVKSRAHGKDGFGRD